MSRTFATIAISLFLARFFLPAESAAEGETIPIAFASLLLAAVGLYGVARSGGSLRLGREDAAVLALSAAHAFSGVFTLFRPTDTRAALNMTWEWLAIAAAVLTLRHACNAADRQRLARAFLSVAVATAGYGVWQYFVWYPEIAAQYDEYQTLADKKEDASLTRGEQRRLTELGRQLGPVVTGADREGRTRLRARVVDSTEPIGFFALTNTLGGVLAVAILIVVSGRSPGRPSQAAAALAALLLGLCLLLTKSRTAVLALIVGGAALAIAVLWGRVHKEQIEHESSSEQNSRWAKLTRWTRGARMQTKHAVAVGVFGTVLLTAVPLALVFVGGLDREVLTEAPKSLQYRIEYWRGTAGVIADQPLLGAGLGNFRAEYLRHKLPGSSEEIRDPHNFLLEAWSTAGLPGLAALLFSFFVAFRRAAPAENALGPPAGRVVPPLLGSVALAAAMHGAPVHFDTPTLTCGVAACLISLAGAWVWSPAALARAGTFAAVTLSIHLLASGGWNMPVIVQTWLVLWFVLLPPDERENGPPGRSIPPVGLTLSAVVVAALAVGCLLTSLRPNLLRDAAMARGDGAASQGRFEIALDQYAVAAEEDPRSPEPYRRLATLFASGGRYEEAAGAIKNAVERAPGVIPLRQKWGLFTQKAGDAAAAADIFAEAVTRYPNSSELHADLALAQSEAGQDPSAAVAAALRLDDLNSAAGHTDKVLASNLRDELESLVVARSEAP